MNFTQNYFSASLLAAAALFLGASPSWGQSNFAVLGNAALTCTDGNHHWFLLYVR